jgi:hypothetical protein
VKGHQDEVNQEDESDEWAVANITADRLAKNAMSTYDDEGSPFIEPLKVKGNIWQLKIDGKTISKNIMREIQKHKWDKSLKMYWAHKMGTQDVDMIDWDILTQSNKMVTRSKRQWRTKHMAGIGPTADKLFQQKHRSTPICPRCNIHENNKHVHQCKTNDTEEIFNNALEGIEEYMDGNCPKELAKAISMLLRSSRTRMEPVWDEISDEDVFRNNGLSIIQQLCGEFGFQNGKRYRINSFKEQGNREHFGLRV